MPRKKKRGIYDNFNLPKIDMEDLIKKRIKLDIWKMSKDELEISDTENDLLYVELVNFFISLLNDKDIGMLTKEKIVIGINKIINKE